jgi:signal transduction histidine kinase
MRLLEDLARQAGVAGHAVRLTTDLQRSRERLVVAREEERRRLRRDLHDGLGPTLAAVALQVETVRSLLREDPAAADALLAKLKDETQSAIANIRRIVYDLRPPALDELGLVGALREEGSRFAANGGSLLVSVEGADDLPPLPAAVEVAAYRIALEGITNAARHSGASTCVVRIASNGGLDVEVRDDGRGLPADFRPGVGLISMRERVAELGGTFTVEPAVPAGTRIHAHLPVADP